MASVDLRQELSRMVEGLQVAQKKGCFNLDEAAVIHSAIIKVQQTNLNSQGSDPALKEERDQLVNLLEEYKRAIEEFKKQHDELLFNMRVEKETNKELNIRVNNLEKENNDLRNDLSELVNDDVEEEVIPVVSEKPKKKGKK